MTEVKRNVSRVIVGLGLVSLAFAAMDLVYEKDPHVTYEAWFNFYGFFALVVAFALVAIAGVLRFVVSRDEDFYDG